MLHYARLSGILEEFVELKYCVVLHSSKIRITTRFTFPFGINAQFYVHEKRRS